MHLTDSRRPVTSLKPVRNWPWLILSMPFRIMLGIWNWIMESKPTGNYRRFRR